MLTTRICVLLIAIGIVLGPWLLWRIAAVRRVAPLAVLQILAGVAFGPSLFGRLAPQVHAALFTPPVLGALDGIAGIGVLFYVFVTGLHVDAAVLRRDGRRLGRMAAASIAAPLLLGALAGAWMVGTVPGVVGAHGPAAAIAAVAICTAVTALPVLAAILREMGIIGTRVAQTALAVAALNDAALWLMLAALVAVSTGAGGWLLAVKLAGALAWGGFMLGPVRTSLRRMDSTAPLAVLVAGSSVAFASAAMSEALGTGYLIGAFLAGLVMPVGARAILLAQIEPLAAMVLLPFFFVITGLRAFIDPGAASFLLPLLAVTVSTIAGKVTGTALAASGLGFSRAEKLALGAMMQTKGLMEVVALTVLADAGLIGGGLFSAMVAMAMVCTVITAPTIRLCLRPAEVLVAA